MTGVSVPSPGFPFLVVTGLSGAGLTSALKALEDIGFETVDNPPFALIATLSAGATGPMAVGIDGRTRGFDAGALPGLMDDIRASGMAPQLVFLTADTACLERRFVDTRRRHPLSRLGSVRSGISADRALMEPAASLADHVIDTTDITAHDLRRLLRGMFDPAGASAPVLTIMSFSYKKGIPREADYVFDVRFLKNPHWDEKLRPLTGLDDAVGGHIRSDPAYAAFEENLFALMDVVLPRMAAEGKSYVTIAFGCTGGKHRSVFTACRLAAHLGAQGCAAQVLHRDLS